MRTRPKNRIAAVAVPSLTVAALLLAACSSSPSTSGSAASPSTGGSTGGPGATNSTGSGAINVTIGSTLPLTGFGAPYGKFQLQGLEVGLQDARKLYGVKFNLISTDSQATAGPAVTEGRKLMADDKAATVVTSFSAPPVAQLGIAQQYQVPLMNCGGNTPDLTGHSWLFNNAFMAAQGAYAALYYAYNTLKVKKISVIVDTSYPLVTGTAFQQAWSEVSGGGKTDVQFIDSATTDASPNINKALGDNPGALFLAVNGNALSLVLNQLTQRNLSIPVISNDGAILGTPQAQTIPFTVYYANSSNQPSQNFLNEYHAMWGASQTPDFESLACYNLALTLAQAVKKVNGEGEAITGANIQKMLADTSNTYNIDGGGVLQYSSNHQTTGKAIIVKYQGGKGTTVATGVPTAPNAS